jgi:hypothetical protein
MKTDSFLQLSDNHSCRGDQREHEMIPIPDSRTSGCNNSWKCGSVGGGSARQHFHCPAESTYNCSDLEKVKIPTFLKAMFPI